MVTLTKANKYRDDDDDDDDDEEEEEISEGEEDFNDSLENPDFGDETDPDDHSTNPLGSGDNGNNTTTTANNNNNVTDSAYQQEQAIRAYAASKGITYEQLIQLQHEAATNGMGMDAAGYIDYVTSGQKGIDDKLAGTRQQVEANQARFFDRGFYNGLDDNLRASTNEEINELNALRGNVSNRFNQAGDALSASFNNINPQLQSLYNQTGQFQNYENRFGQTANQFNQSTQGLGQTAGALRTQMGGQVQGVADRFQGISQGYDPRYEAYKEAQFAQLDANTKAQQGQNSDFFARRGLGGSSAALTQQNNIAGAANLQKQALTGQLGMQQLQRQDQALSQVAGLAQQRAGLESGLLGQQFGMAQGVAQQNASLTAAQQGALAQRLGMAQSISGQQAQNALGLASTRGSLASQFGSFNQSNIQAKNTFNRNKMLDLLGIRESELGAITAGNENLNNLNAQEIAALAAFTDKGDV